MKGITPDNPYSSTYDLTNCDNEPIHIIQTVQNFAAILAVDISDWQVCHTSSNISNYIGKQVQEVLEQPLQNIFPSYVIEALETGVEKKDFSAINPITLPTTSEFMDTRILIAHLKESQLILEIEKANREESGLSFLNKIDSAIQKIQSAKIGENLFQAVTTQVKSITGYDRVMIYKFDKDYNGEVIAEEKEAALEPFLGIRYPATDIPKQARSLFLTNRVRMLIDVDEDLSMMQPSVHPVTKKPLNVGSCAARGVSPIHLEYLRNMGVRATLNVAIVEDGKLWGLIACHHYSDKKILSYQTRSLVRFMGQIISGHLSLFRANEYRENLLSRNKVHARLFEQMNQDRDVVQGLMDGETTLLDYIPSVGVALIFEDEIKTLGETPSTEDIQHLTTHMGKLADQIIFSSSCLSDHMSEIASFKNDFTGALAIKISEEPAEYIIWFREAKVKEVYWGGNPEKAVQKLEDSQRLSPRKSFEKWKQVVENTATPWEKQEIDAALSLRNDIKEIILKRFQEFKKLHADLQVSYRELESFSYSVSHDLRSPLRAIEGFGQILLEDYSDQLDSYGVEVINTIVSSINRMNEFVNDILSLSKLAKVHMIYNEVDLQSVLPIIIEEFKNSREDYQNIEVVLQKDIPVVSGDYTMVKQLFSNLISNAMKYSAGNTQPKVEIGGKVENSNIVYFIKDNGIGMDKEYIEKIYDVFSRLVTDEEFEGTGIGLSIVRRIIERHHGKIWVDTELGKGSTFWVSFPKVNSEQFLE